MTREEAIQILADLTDNPFLHTWEEQYKALHMAIEALQCADKSPRTVKLTEDIEITLDEEAYEIGYTHGQMADRPNGEWIFNPTDAIDLMFAKPKCSKCGFESSDGGNYCSNCGAKMRGEEE